ncbi:MAG TPA: hypothetical protein VFZ89_04680 [Solirubrobacteraceae bacterium]
MGRLARAVVASVALSWGVAAGAVAAAEFTVTYRGTGEYRTTFRAHPPNPGGADDRNVARDRSTQRWAITFHRTLAIPACGPAPDGSPDPCTRVSGVRDARGRTQMIGHVDHRHDDGLYPSLDRTVRCTLRARTGPRASVAAELQVRYLPGPRAFAITALNPISTVITRFPAQCPRQGDSIDRVLDFYAMPGFSFAEGYGPDRWFTSREVVIPAARFATAQRVRVALADTPAGRPPRGCARPNPAYERCTTGGDWRGELTFTKRAASARAAALRTPRGRYKRGSFLMIVSGRSIQIAAFDFTCRGTRGRTSLNDIAIRKERGRWRFSERMGASVSYADGRPDENAWVRFSGRFSPTAVEAAGSFEVSTPRCGRVGPRTWSARRS